MSESRPIDEQTVKALSWQLLYGNYRPKLGTEGWAEIAETVGAPDFRKMDSDEDCPMGPFNEAVLWIDRVLGEDDGRDHDVAVRARVEVAKLQVFLAEADHRPVAACFGVALYLQEPCGQFHNRLLVQVSHWFGFFQLLKAAI